jgi:hypothetical protein
MAFFILTKDSYRQRKCETGRLTAGAIPPRPERRGLSRNKMKNNLEARTRLISEEKLQRELALQRFEKANSMKHWAYYGLVVAAVVVLVAFIASVGSESAEAHNNSQVSIHNYCMVHDCLVTPEAAKYMESDGHGKVLTEEDIE